MRSLGIARWSQLQAQGFVLAAAETDTVTQCTIVHSVMRNYKCLSNFSRALPPACRGQLYLQKQFQNMYNYDDNAADDDDDDAGKKVKVGDILKLTTCSPASS